MKHEELRDKLYKKLMQHPRNSERNDKIAWEISFQLSDWVHNLDDILHVLHNFETMNDDEIYSKVLSFSIHVPEHLHAARNYIQKLNNTGSE
jgi:hypothetical protein